MKLFLVILISIFFPEFVKSADIVVIVFMALYWPILAVSEATLLLARKQFRKLYLSSCSAILFLVFSALFNVSNFSFQESASQSTLAAITVCFANFIFYCMLKYQGGIALRYSVKDILFNICKTVAWVSILLGCYYSNLLIVSVILMFGMLMLVLKSSIFKKRVAS